MASMEYKKTGMTLPNNQRGLSATASTHLSPRVQPVHEGQQRGHNGCVDLVLLHGAHRGQPVDLVEKYD